MKCKNGRNTIEKYTILTYNGGTMGIQCE